MKVKTVLYLIISISFAAIVVFNYGNESSDIAVSSYDNNSPNTALPIKILFIGNSYTSTNNLPQLLHQISISKGQKIHTTMIAPGGYRFKSHASNANTLKTISSEQWDYVILQNQSLIPGLEPKQVQLESLPFATSLVNLIKTNNKNTNIIYFVTWGRKNGTKNDLCKNLPNTCSYSGHTAALLKGYKIYQSKTGGKLAPIGATWEAVVNDRQTHFNPDKLWSPDGSHPSILGSYLSAVVLFKTIFKYSPIGADAPSSISSSDAAYLQKLLLNTKCILC